MTALAVARGAYAWLSLRPWAAYALAAVLLVAATYGLGVWRGANEAREAARVETLERAVRAHETWSETDAEISRADAVRLCVDLGGLRDDCERRLLAGAPAPAD